MQLIRERAYARAGLLGNPSDGYHGKTISLTVQDLRAEVVLYEWEDVEIVLSRQSQSRFGSVRELVHDVRAHGYYGGIRLIHFCHGLMNQSPTWTVRSAGPPRNLSANSTSAS